MEKQADEQMSKSRWTAKRHYVKKSRIETYFQNDWNEFGMQEIYEPGENSSAQESSEHADTSLSTYHEPELNSMSVDDISIEHSDGELDYDMDYALEEGQALSEDGSHEDTSNIDDDPFVMPDSEPEIEDEDLEDEEDNMKEELSEQEILEIRRLWWKLKYNISDNAYDDLPDIVDFDINNFTSLYRAKKRLSRLTGIIGTNLHCCVNSCVAYTGDYATLKECPVCHEPRLADENKPRKKFTIIPLIPRLQLQYKDLERARHLRYRAEYIQHMGNFGDVFDGDAYMELCDQGFFSDERDVALGVSTDGFQIFRQRTNDCWPILIINYNIAPTERVKRENLLLYGIIPGPKQPKEIASFLQPLVDELKQLEAGVEAYDAATKQSFTLKAHLILVSGDLPAIAKVGCFKGSNGLSPCRFCQIKGTLQQEKRHYYCPLTPPEGQIGVRYNATNLPMRTHTDIMMIGEEINEVAKQDPKASYVNERSRSTGQFRVVKTQTL
jgi:hypothetical protein